MNFITDKTVSGLPVILQLVSDLLQIVPGDVGKCRAIRLVLIPFGVVVILCTIPLSFRSQMDS